MENPIEMPSTLTKRKSNEIISGLRFVNIKKNVTKVIKKMK